MSDENALEEPSNGSLGETPDTLGTENGGGSEDVRQPDTEEKTLTAEDWQKKYEEERKRREKADKAIIDNKKRNKKAKEIEAANQTLQDQVKALQDKSEHLQGELQNARDTGESEAHLERIRSDIEANQQQLQQAEIEQQANTVRGHIANAYGDQWNEIQSTLSSSPEMKDMFDRLNISAPNARQFLEDPASFADSRSLVTVDLMAKLASVTEQNKVLQAKLDEKDRTLKNPGLNNSQSKSKDNFTLSTPSGGQSYDSFLTTMQTKIKNGNKGFS